MLTHSAKRALKWTALVVAAALAVMVAGFVVWTRVARYPAFPDAAALAQTAETPQGWYVFEPEQPTGTGFILYPGGLVDPAAYAPLAERVSEGGVKAVIVPMPLDLAVFGQDRAAGVIAAYPEVERWVVGGHSLGGAMSAEFVKHDPSAVAGIVFLAAYPADATDLSALQIGSASVYGTNDRVAAAAMEDTATLLLLPQSTRTVAIEGGNHAQFGEYGPQTGDGAATISSDEQQRQAAEAILDLAYGITP